jgi:hypothetical protein
MLAAVSRVLVSKYQLQFEAQIRRVVGRTDDTDSMLLCKSIANDDVVDVDSRKSGIVAGLLVD